MEAIKSKCIITIINKSPPLRLSFLSENIFYVSCQRKSPVNMSGQTLHSLICWLDYGKQSISINLMVIFNP